MPYFFSPITNADIASIARWRYPGPYSVYDIEDDDLSELLDPRSPYFAVRESMDTTVAPIGFFAYGTAGMPGGYDAPYLLAPDGSLCVGLGLRPDQTGQGKGVSFVLAGLAFASAQFAPITFRLYVLTFNHRAIRVYERAGFIRVGVVTRPYPTFTREFLEMTRPA